MSIKTRILIVEDRNNWRTTFSHLLKDLGYETAEATCGEEFKKLASEADVIVLDISMPKTPLGDESKTEGLDALMELQGKHPGHLAIDHPIIRSMWEPEEFQNTPYSKVKVEKGFWVSRNIPIADLLSLIARVEILTRQGGT